MKKVLIVAMVDSIHTARWVSQFQQQALSVMLFPSGPHRRVHQQIRDLINGDQRMQVALAPMMGILALPLYLVDYLLPVKTRARYLSRLISRWQPNIIHALETQHGGYLVSDAISWNKEKPEIRLSIWGSDLVWFSSVSRHQKKIRNILSKTDYLSVECRRDIELARSMGFVGQLLPVIPASGAVDISENFHASELSRASSRRVILVKGYSGFVGRALIALRALEEIAADLVEYEIHVYSASIKTARYARQLLKRSKLRIVIHRKHKMTHREMMALFSRARISISISLSDGFPGSLREAMMSGCFPIESVNSCGHEWAIPGETAFFVDPNHEKEVVSAVKRALDDDSLVDSASELNMEIAKIKFSTVALKELVDSYYLRDF